MLVSAIPALERVVLSAGAGMIVTTALPKGTVESVDLGKSVVIVAPGRLVDLGKTAAVGRMMAFVEQERAVPIAAPKGVVKAAGQGKAVVIVVVGEAAKAADPGKAAVVVAVGMTVAFVGRGIVVPAVPAKIPGRVSGD